MTKIGDSVTVSRYWYDGTMYRNFKGTVKHIYTNSCCIQYDSKSGLPVSLNGRIVVANRYINNFSGAEPSAAYKKLSDSIIKLNAEGYIWKEISEKLGVSINEINKIKRTHHLTAKDQYKIKIFKHGVTWYITSKTFLLRRGVHIDHLVTNGWHVTKGLWRYKDIGNKAQIIDKTLGQIGLWNVLEKVGD